MSEKGSLSPLARCFAALSVLALMVSGAHCQGLRTTYGLWTQQWAVSQFDVRTNLSGIIGGILAESRAAAVAEAQGRGVPTSGPGFELVGMDGDKLVYYQSLNVNAAISTAADVVRQQVAYDGVSGSRVLGGIWDGGVPLTNHQEFGGRIVVRDGGAVDYHPTHVAGTMVATGINAQVKGMAPAGRLDAYDWNGDEAEMVAAGAATAADTNRVVISNHSYGIVCGWQGNSWYGRFVDDATPANDVEDDFGRYSAQSVSWDGVAFSLPYYLPVKSAGNDRTDGPPAAGVTWLHVATGNTYTYDPTRHPAGDGQYKGGYDTINGGGVGKNILTVGAAADAVSGGARSLGAASLLSFSSTGPTDDGRIKPDVVGNGENLTSTSDTSPTATGVSSGTSMSSPNVSGSAMLLVDFFRGRLPGQTMRASTLKGLIIHTADDLGTAGPDYRFGWGLMNTRAAADLIAAHAAQTQSLRIVERTLSTASPTDTIGYGWDGASPIRATLCWTDPPGTVQSGHDSTNRNLVNDLDIWIEGPAGQRFLPYVMPYAGTTNQALLAAAATTGTNNVDNVEQVYIAAPPTAGVYRVRLGHKGALQGGSQAYSLLFSGGVSADARIIRLAGSFDFGDVVVLGSSNLPLTIYNDGWDVMTVSSIDYPAGFSGAFSGTIPAGGSTNVPVTFTPPAEGEYGGTLRVNSDANVGINTAAVSGFGTLYTFDGPDGGAIPIWLNRQTGLFQQEVRINNAGSAPLSGVRVFALGLDGGIRLWNATGTNEFGEPYYEYEGVIPVGSNVVFTLDYYSPDMVTPAPHLRGWSSLTSAPVPVVGAAYNQLRIFSSAGKVFVEFDTVPGDYYQVQYTSNMVNWIAAGNPVMAGGTKLVWEDTGPPKTYPHPSGAPFRAYRIIHSTP